MARLSISERYIAAVLLAVGVALLFTGLGVFFPSHLPFEGTVFGLAQHDHSVLDGYYNPSESDLRRSLRINLVLFGIAALGCAVLIYRWAQVLPVLLDRRLFSFFTTIGCSVALFIAIAQPDQDRPFCPVGVMADPGSFGIMGHRLLLPWVADILKLLSPAVSYRQAFLITQFAASVAASHMVAKWSALFIGEKWKFVGQLLLVAIMVPTITYNDFYDMAMVFFFSLALYLLYKRRYALFVAVVGIGVFNHENILVLIVASAVILYGTAPVRTWLGVPLATLAIWFGVRALMDRLVPIETHFDLHLWSNLLNVAHPTGDIVKAASSMMFWWLIAGLGFVQANQFLRRAVIMLPGLVLVTFVMGQYREARQFDAFIPVTIALILTLVQKHTSDDLELGAVSLEHEQVRSAS